MKKEAFIEEKNNNGEVDDESLLTFITENADDKVIMKKEVDSQTVLDEDEKHMKWIKLLNMTHMEVDYR